MSRRRVGLPQQIPGQMDIYEVLEAIAHEKRTCDASPQEKSTPPEKASPPEKA